MNIALSCTKRPAPIDIDPLLTAYGGELSPRVNALDEAFGKCIARRCRLSHLQPHRVRQDGNECPPLVRPSQISAPATCFASAPTVRIGAGSGHMLLRAWKSVEGRSRLQPRHATCFLSFAKGLRPSHFCIMAAISRSPDSTRSARATAAATVSSPSQIAVIVRKLHSA